MPVLDLKVWVAEGQKPKVLHTFFKKPVASPFTIMKRSAISESTKRNTIFQESLRRLQHISPECGWVEYAKHLTEYSQTLRLSGYSSRERYETIKGAINRHKEMEEKVRKGEITSMNRTRKEIQERKAEKGGITAGSWYLGGETVRVMTVQPTPGGKLLKAVKNSINKDTSNGKTMVVEDGGQPAIASLKEGDPFRKEGCKFTNPDCMVDIKEDCTAMGCLYEISCNACQEPVEEDISGSKTTKDPGGQSRPNYVGMTSTSLHCRMLGHQAGQKAKSGSNPLWRHDAEKHNGEHQTYTTRILRRERTLLPLCILEAIYIEKQKTKTSMNEKNEWGHGGLVRLRAEKGLT